MDAGLTRNQFLIFAGSSLLPRTVSAQSLAVTFTDTIYSAGAPVYVNVSTPGGGTVGIESQLKNSSFQVNAAVPITKVDLGPAKAGAHPVRIVVDQNKYAATVFLYQSGTGTSLERVAPQASAGSEHPSTIDQAALNKFWANFTNARFKKASAKLLDWFVQNQIGVAGTTITCIVVALVPTMTVACVVGVALKAADAMVNMLQTMVQIQVSDSVLTPAQGDTVRKLLGIANAAIQVGEVTAATGILAKLAAGAGAGAGLLAEADFPAAKLSLKFAADGVQKYTAILDVLRKL